MTTRHQHARLGNQEPARLHPELDVRKALRELRDAGIECAQIDSAVTQLLGNADAAAEIDHAARPESDCASCASSAPVSVQLATSKMPLPVCACSPDDACAGGARQCRQFVGLRQRHAELRVRAGGAHVMVMAAAEARIDAQKDLAAAKHLRPGLERVQIVQGDAHALGEAEFVFAARRKIGSEQYAFAASGRHRAQRHARARPATRTRASGPRHKRAAGCRDGQLAFMA